eukprot:4835473-Alexandrium_andersonii.AAC.1
MWPSGSGPAAPPSRRAALGKSCALWLQGHDPKRAPFPRALWLRRPGPRSRVQQHSLASCASISK